MKKLFVSIKLCVRCGISALSLAGLVACKEAEGFKAASLAGEGGLQTAKQVQPLTPEATVAIESRMRELENIEDDLSLKDENIKNLQAEIEDLKMSIEKNMKLISSSTLSADILENIRTENEEKRAELEATITELNENVDARLADDQALMQKFTELVTELSNYEVTEQTAAFRESVAQRLEFYEADRERLDELVLEKQENIQELNNRISQLESSANTADIQERTTLVEELVSEQESLNQMNERLNSLKNLVDINSCTVNPSSCPADLASPTQQVQNGQIPTSTVENNGGITAEVLKISSDIKDLQSDKDNYNNIIKQLNEQISSVDTKLALAKEAPYQDQILRGMVAQLNVQKNELMEEKSEALARVNDINNKISRLARFIVSK